MNGSDFLTVDTFMGAMADGSWLESVRPLLVSQMWQVTLAILLAGFFSLRWGARFPTAAYLFWVLVIVKVLMPPIWSSPAGMFTWLDTARSSWPHESVDSLVPQNDMPLRSGPRLNPNESHHEVLATWSNAEKSTTSTVATAAAPSILPSPMVVKGLLILWLSVAAFLLLYACMQWSRLWSHLRDSRSAPPEWLQDQVEALRKEIGFSREVRVRLSNSGFGPLVMGYLRPTVVLPAALIERCDRSRIRLILAHELVHAKRGDGLVSGFQFLAQSVWWFHPLVWWANRQMNRWCEQSCDAEVLALTDCQPRDYAHSLLDVLELKHQVRTLPAAAGIRTADLTRRRLEAILSRKSALNFRSNWWQWALLVLGALVLLPGAKYNLIESKTIRSEPIVYDQLQSMNVRANTAFQVGAWEAAAEDYRGIVQLAPDDAKAWFRLGYSLHALGEMEEALSAHQTAAKFSETKPIALYNWACALAVLERPDAAMAKLDEAISTGFRSRFPIQNDPDLKSLTERTAFRELALVALAPSAFMDRNEFDFWIGSWEVFDKKGKLVGTNEITSQQDGNLLIEKWEGQSGVSGTSMNYFDPAEETWKQTWVDSQGTIIEYEGGFEDGKMKMTGKFVNRKGDSQLSRMTVAPMPNGHVTQLIERSSDAGKTWDVYFEGTYVRKTVKREEATGDGDE